MARTYRHRRRPPIVWEFTDSGFYPRKVKYFVDSGMLHRRFFSSKIDKTVSKYHHCWGMRQREQFMDRSQNRKIRHSSSMLLRDPRTWDNDWSLPFPAYKRERWG